MKHALVSLIGGVALAVVATCGVAQSKRSPPSGPADPCNSGICKIDVTVNNCGAAGGITVNRPFLSMSKTGSSTVIHWTIVTPGHVFAADGIRFDPAAPDFQRLPGGQPNVIRMKNTKATLGDFYYWVKVANCVPLDPFIRNDP